MKTIVGSHESTSAATKLVNTWLLWQIVFHPPSSDPNITGAPQTVPLLDRADITEMSYAEIRLEQT